FKNGLQKQLEIIEEIGMKMDIKFNPTKTVFMKFNNDKNESNGKDLLHTELKLDGTSILKVDEMKYLGFDIDEQDKCVKHLSKRKKMSLLALTHTTLWNGKYNQQKTTMNLLKRTDGNILKMTFGLPTRCRTKDLQLALNINLFQNQITKQKLDFYERLCSNELTRKILQHSSKQKLDKDILEEVAIIIEEYSEYHLVSSQVSTSDKIKAIKYVIDVDFKADKESNNNSKSIRQLLQSRKTNLKEELFKWLRFDRDN
ncbi:hypothetical protein BpHYR1_016823, partial [Brachionus plicatilis]